MTTPPSLEDQLIAALLADDREEARRVAAILHERGFDYAALAPAIAAHPQLEEALWAVMDQVRPLARRAARRRAIRAAEERDWGDWEAGKRKPK